MRVVPFFKELGSDIKFLYSNKDTFETVKIQRIKSLFFRGMGLLVLADSTINLLSMTLTPQITVAHLAYKLFMVAIGYDLIVTGNNMRSEIAGSFSRPLKNIAWAKINGEHRHLQGTVIAQSVYCFFNDLTTK